MPAVAHTYVVAGAALAAASVVAVTPIAPRPSEIPVTGVATRLAAAEDSILNIPFNLFQDLVNIPYNQVQATDEIANSLFFDGTWWDFDATNLWGTDPGDPGKYMSLVDLLLPFPAISGLGSPEIDPTADAAGTAGLGQQLALLAAAELPVSASCDAETCAPFFPVTPITGITSLDQGIWEDRVIWNVLTTGSSGHLFPLIDNWIKGVPFSGPDSLATGYHFGTVVDPSGPAYAGFGLPGTGPGDTMPWSGDTFTLNLAAPFENFYNSLLAPPNLSGFEFASPTDVYHAFTALLAGLVVDFQPFVPGNPSCPGTCDLASVFPTVSLVKDIQAIDPTNSLINEWVTAAQNGTANGPTPVQVADMIAGYQQGVFDSGPLGQLETTLSADLNTLWTVLSTEGTQPSALFADLSTLLGGVGTTLSTDLNDLWANLLSAF